jgi:hypothetical protein
MLPLLIPGKERAGQCKMCTANLTGLQDELLTLVAMYEQVPQDDVVQIKALTQKA